MPQLPFEKAFHIDSLGKMNNYRRMKALHPAAHLVRANVPFLHVIDEGVVDNSVASGCGINP